MNIIILGFFGGFLWSCFRVAAAIVVGVTVGIAVAAIASAVGLAPVAGAALGIAAAVGAGAATYAIIGPYQETTSSSKAIKENEKPAINPVKPKIEIVSKEVVIPIRFKEPDVQLEGERCPSKRYYCEIKEDNDWKSIQGNSPKDMLDQVRSHFTKIIEQRRISDQKVVDNKKTKTFFTIDVYKKPFPGDNILSELWELKKECFNDNDNYNAYDKEYSESESEGDKK